MMIGIVFATRREADPFLGQTGAVPIAARPFEGFRIDDIATLPVIVMVGGMGKVAATMASSHLVLAHKAAVLINAGLCGRLTGDQSASVGDCFRIRTAVEGDCDRFGRPEPAVSCDTRWFAALAAARLVTCDRPVFDARQRAELALVADLVDMEGAAVARVAALYGIPCAMLKGVSDGANETGRQDLARNIDRVSVRIGEALIDGLRTIPG